MRKRESIRAIWLISVSLIFSSLAWAGGPHEDCQMCHKDADDDPLLHVELPSIHVGRSPLWKKTRFLNCKSMCSSHPRSTPEIRGGSGRGHPGLTPSGVLDVSG